MMKNKRFLLLAFMAIFFASFCLGSLLTFNYLEYVRETKFVTVKAENLVVDFRIKNTDPAVQERTTQTFCVFSAHLSEILSGLEKNDMAAVFDRVDDLISMSSILLELERLKKDHRRFRPELVPAPVAPGGSRITV